MTDGRVRVLILGGYGTFGGRLARLLATEPELTRLIAGQACAPRRERDPPSRRWSWRITSRFSPAGRSSEAAAR